MFKNVASQKLIVFAFDSTTNAPKTGDAANLTAYVSKDFGSVTVLGDTSATEMDATNAKGYYLFDLTQGETNADTLLFSGKSSTSNVVVVGVPATVFTAPATGFLAPATSGRTLVVDAAGLADANVVKLGPTGSGTAQTARDVGLALPAVAPAAVGGLLTAPTTANTGLADVTRLLGTAWLTPGTAGTPDVNVKLWNALTTVALPLVPTVAGRTLDVSATGEGGVDWANVGGQSTAVNLSATTVNLTNTLTTYTGNTVQTGDSFARIGATGSGLTSLAPSATALSTAQWTNARAGYLDNVNNSTLAAASFPTDPADESLIIAATDAIMSRIGVAGAGLTAVGLAATQTFNNTGTWTGNVVGTVSTLTTYTGNTPQTGDNYARLGAPAGASISADIATRATPAQILTTALTESYNADGAAPTLSQAAFVVMQMLTEMSIAGTTMTVKRLDGTTTALTLTLNDATTPTSITRAT